MTIEPDVPPLFLGGHPAVDFLNTAFVPEGRPVETIGDGRAFVDWLVGAGLIDEATAARLLRRVGGKAMDSAAAEARKVREWARYWLTRWRVAPESNYGEEIAALNELLARGSSYREVVTAEEGLGVVERARIETADAPLALLASHIAALVTQEQPSLVKQCAGSGCTLWFLDRTKSHRRMFCSATVCGNRAKVAAYRRRQRARQRPESTSHQS